MSYKDTYPDTAADQSHAALWLLFLFFIVFVLVGLWLVMDASNAYDVLMGGLSSLLFGGASIAVGYKLKTM
jgi:hypothetical protein